MSDYKVTMIDGSEYIFKSPKSNEEGYDNSMGRFIVLNDKKLYASRIINVEELKCQK